jgi:transposase-like protein
MSKFNGVPKAQFGLYLRNVSGVLTTVTLQDSYYC